MNVTQLTKSQLEAAQNKAGKAVSAACDALIAAGRGREPVADCYTKDDKLSVAYAKAGNLYQELSAEGDRRMRYHGTKHRILKAA